MRQEYLNSIKAGAIEGWYKYKITPSLTAAQAALESGWGTSKLAAPPYNNNFGIKAGADWTGKTASMSTQEWNGSKFVTTVDTFRAYDSINDSVEDHGVFFTSTEWRINNYRNVVGEGDYKKACYAVANAGYATDPNYATKLINIIETYNLQSWDVEAQNGNPNNVALENTKASKIVGGAISSAASQSVSSLLLSVIGDSLGVGTEKFLNKYPWAKVFHDNLGSRQWTHSTASLDATKILQTMINNNNLQQNVVFILGTNRGVTAEEIDNVVSMCGRDRNIILVDTASEVNHRNTVSNAYSEASKRHQNVFYANWSDYARANIATWYNADGANGTRIHMKDIGYQKHAEFIIQAVYEAANTNWVEEVSTPTEKNTERVNIYDVEYDDGKYTSPKGDSSIYNKELNDQLGFRPKKAQIMWIERKYTGEEDNAADLLEAALKKMDEYSVPAAQYTVPMRYFPPEVSIGDTGYFIDHEFNPPLYIFARVLSMTTSVSNPGNDSVVIGNVIEVHPKDKADILALQKELQENREEARLEYWKVPPIVLQIISSNGLNFKTKPGELYSELVHSTVKEPEVKNGFVDIPVHNAKKVGARIAITGSIKNNYIDIVDEITSEINAPIAEEVFTGPVDPNSNPQGNIVKDITAPLDVRQLIAKQLDVRLLDSAGLNMGTTTLSVYEDSTFALKVEGLPKHINKIRILSNQNIILDDISALDMSDPVSGATDKTRLYVKAFQEDTEVTHKFKNFSWTRISSNKRLDEEWNDAHKFNETNGIDLMPADVFGNESTFVCKMFDENGKFVAATSSSVTITQEGNKNTISDSTMPPTNPSPGDKWTAIDGDSEEEYHYVDGEWVQTGVSKKVDTALEEAESAKQAAEKSYTDAVAEANRLADEADALIKAEIEREISEVETELTTAKQEAIEATDKALADAKAHAIAQDAALKTSIQSEIDAVGTELSTAKQEAIDATDKALTDAKAHAIAQDTALKLAIQSEIDAVETEASEAKQAAQKAYTDAIAEAEAKVQAKDKEYKLIFDNYDSTIETIETDTQTAKTKADQALEEVGISTDLAQTAKDLADTAKTNAQTALNNASKAQTDVSNAVSNASQAKTDASQAKADAQAAITEAGEAVDSANTAKTNAQTAINDAQTALSTAKSANTKSGLAETAANTAKTNAQTALNNSNTAITNASNAITKAGQAETTANTAKTNAQTALDNAQSALMTAGNADTKSGLAETAANTAKTNAQTALDNSSTAIANAEDAITKAGEAETIANTAKTNAQTAIDDAQEALTKAGNAKTTADTLSVKVDDLEGEVELKASQTEVDGISGTVSTHTTTLSQQATAIASKADKTVVDTLSGTVSNQRTLISQNATDIASKASSELVDTIKDTVDSHTTEISQNAEAIESKASSKSVSTLTGRVSTAETAITQNAEAIESKASQTEVDDISGTVSTHTTTIGQHATAIASKADKTVVDTLSGTVTNQGTLITQNATNIASKASSQLVDTIKETVDTHTTEISQNATAIESKANATTVDALEGRVDTAESNISQNATAITQRVTTSTYNTGLGTKENNVLKQSTAPGHLNGRLWLDTSVTPNILKRSTGSAWVKATPTTANEVGAYSSSQGATLAGRVTTAETNITQTATAITSKADKSTVDALAGTVNTQGTTITQQADLIESKANQSEVDIVKGTVSGHTTTLSQHATSIASKAEKSLVDTIKGTVDDHTTDISQNATDIASKASASSVNTLTGRVDTAESNISQNATAITQRVTTTTYNAGIASKENTVLKQTTAPTHVNGRLWLDTSTTPNVLKRSNGSAWIKATPTTASEVGAYSQSDGSGLAGRLTTAETNITQTSTAITSKADKSVVDTLSGTVSTHTTTLSQQATAIASKADKTVVDTLSGTVDDHTTEIAQNATDIATKASASSVNTLTGRVSTAESNISQNATAITQRVTTSTYNTGMGSKENSVLKQSTSPAHSNGRLWLDTSVTPNILKRSNGTTWIKATPTTPGEVGAYSQAAGEGLAGRLTTAETNITQTSTAITSKADKSVVDTLTGTVNTQGTTITQQANLIKSKADQTEVDTIKGTVNTHTTKISQNATDIATKASASSVNTLTGRVSTAETSIGQNATAITSKANQSEVDTVKGTVSDHTSTLSQHASQISARLTSAQVNTLVDGKGLAKTTYVDTQIKASADGITAEMTKVEGKIDGLQVGGTNLIIRSKEIINKVVDTSGHASTQANNSLAPDISVEVGKDYTFTKTSSGITENYFRYGWYRADGTFISRNATTSNMFTVKAPTNAAILKVSYPTVSKVQVEKGNKATDWSPAPEDTVMENDFKVFKGEYEATAESLASRLTAVDKAGGRLSTAESNISQNATAINARLTTSQVNSLVDGKGFATQTWANNQISATANGIRTEISSVESKIPQYVGGRNLLKNSDFSKGLDNWGTNYSAYLTISGNIASVSSGQDYAGIFQNVSVSQTTEGVFTVSATVRGTGSIRLAVHNGDNQSFTLTKDWRRISATFKSSSTSTITFTFYTVTQATSVEMKDFQIEEGSVLTAYSVSPEDYYDYANTTITAEAGRVEQLITNVKNNPTGTITGYNSLKNNVDSMVQAIGSDGGKIAQMVMTDSVFKTTVAKQSDVFKNYRVYAISYSSRTADWAKWGSSRIIRPDGSLAPVNANHTDRSYFLYVISENGTEMHSKVYDVYVDAAQATTLANDIKSFTNRQYLIILMGSHAPTSNRTAGGLPQAIYEIGGSPEIFINEDWSNQPAYLLVGKPGLGQGRGYEYFVPALQGGSFDITIPVLNGSTPLIDSSIQAVNSQVTQLADSWALTLKSGNDIKTQINASTSSLRLSSKFIHLNGSSLIDNATIKSAHIDTLNASKVTGTTADFNTIRAGVLTADAVTATHIKSENALIDTIFANQALVDRLWAKSIWTSKINTMSLDAARITSGTISAARLNASDIVTSGLTTDVVKSTHIQTSTLLVDKIFANQAMVDRLWSKTIWANKITAMELNASQIKAGTISTYRLNTSDIVTAGLTTDVVKSTHIQTSSLLVDKIFATQAMVDHLWSKSIWTTKLTALKIDASQINAGTINAARLNVKEIVTNGLSTDVVTSTHIKADSALFNTLFSTSSATTRLVAQGAWIENANIKNIDASKINAGTINAARISTSSLNNVEIGGLNFLRNSNFANGFSKWSRNYSEYVTLKDGYINVNGTSFAGVYQNQSHGLIIEQGEMYTLSAYARGQGNIILGFHQGGSQNIPVNSSEWIRVSYSTNATGSGTVTYYTGTNGANLDMKNLQLELGNKYTAWSPSPDDIVNDLGTSGRVEIHGGNIKADTLDVGAITGDKAKFISLSFESLNSNMQLTAGAIRLQNSAGDFATMNTIPEFRSQDSAGTAAIMGKGRSHYYSGNQARFYIGSNLEGLSQYGIHIAKGQTFGIYRNSDTYGGEAAKYYNTPSGFGAVQVVERLISLGYISGPFATGAAFIKNLNGWGSTWPVLQPGEPVMYKAAVPGNSSGVETLWSMGTSSSGVTRLYSYPEHVFDYRIEVKGRARFIAQALFENNFVNNSDRRIKHDIKDTEVTALDHLDSLTFKEYKMNSTGNKVLLGLIAQDSGILRVKGEDEGDYEGIDGMMMPMLAMKGVQELHAIVKEQAEEIRRLKEKINK